VEGKTPLELWTESYATLGHLRAFGTECYVHIPKLKSTSGTRRVGWVDWSNMWVKRMAIEFGYVTKGRLC